MNLFAGNVMEIYLILQKEMQNMQAIQEDFDAEFEKFKKEFAEKHKNDESTSF